MTKKQKAPIDPDDADLDDPRMKLRIRLKLAYERGPLVGLVLDAACRAFPPVEPWVRMIRFLRRRSWPDREGYADDGPEPPDKDVSDVFAKFMLGRALRSKVQTPKRLAALGGLLAFAALRPASIEDVKDKVRALAADPVFAPWASVIGDAVDGLRAPDDRAFVRELRDLIFAEAKTERAGPKTPAKRAPLPKLLGYEEDDRIGCWTLGRTKVRLSWGQSHLLEALVRRGRDAANDTKAVLEEWAKVALAHGASRPTQGALATTYRRLADRLRDAIQSDVLRRGRGEYGLRNDAVRA